MFQRKGKDAHMGRYSNHRIGQSELCSSVTTSSVYLETAYVSDRQGKLSLAILCANVRYHQVNEDIFMYYISYE